jgi:hypothetical protein
LLFLAVPGGFWMEGTILSIYDNPAAEQAQVMNTN